MDSESFHLVLAKERAQRCTCIPARYVLTILIFWGLFVVYLLRANLSVALVAMVNNSAVALPDGNHSHQPYCLTVLENHSVNSSDEKEKYDFERDGEVLWDLTTQSLVLGAFYYGYAATQLPGGWIAERWGGKWPFGLGIFLTSIFTILTPAAARSSVVFVVLIRIAKGLGEGITYPAMYALFSRWAPLKERSLLIAVASVGANLGTILGMPATALFCEHGFDGGWPSAFYVCGVLGCLWFIPWAIVAASRPTRYSTITDTELVHLKLHLGPLKKRPPTPWKYILSSPPVWAATFARFASCWGLYTLITELPNYLQNVIGLNINENGAVNAIVYLFQSIGMILGGYLSDLMRTRSSVAINTNRKIFETIGCLGPAICLIFVPLAGCDGIWVAALITSGQFLYGFNAGGSIPAMVDLAPDLAGTVTGFVLTVANIAGVLAPMVAGKFAQHGQDFSHWKYVFVITSGIYAVSGAIFVIFGSAEVQPWGHPVDVPTDTTKPKRKFPIHSPSASFSGRTQSLSNMEIARFRSRFSTVAILPERRSSDEDDLFFEERRTSNSSYVKEREASNSSYVKEPGASNSSYVKERGASNSSYVEELGACNSSYVEDHGNN